MSRGVTKKEIIDELKKREVEIGFGKGRKWVPATGFGWDAFSKRDVLELYQGSRKKRRR